MTLDTRGVAYPVGAVSGALPVARGEQAQVVQSDPTPAVLLALGVWFQSASARLSGVAQRAGADLWGRMRPVNDAGLRDWTRAWDRVLAGASAQQGRLTESYARASLSRYGIEAPQVTPLVPEGRVEALEDWLDSPAADSVDPALHDEAEAILRRIEGNQQTWADLSRADRLPWLHSPVIDARSRLGSGERVDEAFDAIVSRLGGMTDAALRTSEADVVSSVPWPQFKNGRAMLYKRVVHPGCCGWCRVVATRLYSLESYKRGSTWHTHCRCTMVLVTQAEAERYARTARDTDGNYYEAAGSIGLWTGPTTPGAYVDVIGQRATSSPDQSSR